MTSASTPLSQHVPSSISSLGITIAVLLFALGYFRMTMTSTRRTSKSIPLEYGLFHLALNRLPGESEDEPPKTEWLNMGYWKGAGSFPEACRALTLKVISAAGLKEGDSVLDVGFGTGECLVLLLSDPSVPRPAKLSGITELKSHCERTQARLERINANNPACAQVEIDQLFPGDAVYSPGSASEGEHPLDPASLDNFDVMLATDCAYHFNTRRAFLTQALGKLRPGGRIALADICFDDTAIDSRWTRAVTFVLRLMPLENRVSVTGYRKLMQDVGYDEVSCEDITEDVFPYFIAFLKSRGWAWWVFACVLQLYTSAGARFVVISGRKPVENEYTSSA